MENLVPENAERRVRGLEDELKARLETVNSDYALKIEEYKSIINNLEKENRLQDIIIKGLKSSIKDTF